MCARGVARNYEWLAWDDGLRVVRFLSCTVAGEKAASHGFFPLPLHGASCFCLPHTVGFSHVLVFYGCYSHLAYDIGDCFHK